MKGRIYLKWAKSDQYFNFGDDLNPYLIKKLSNVEIRYIEFAGTRINLIKLFFCNLFCGKATFKFLSQFIHDFFVPSYIIAIGSILQWYASKRCIVWGTGIIDRQTLIRRCRFLAVRGEYTRNQILKSKFEPPFAVGDPALLLPIVYRSKAEKKYLLGVIPHFSHYEKVNQKRFSSKVLLINLNNSNVEVIIDNILSCEYIISSSLHGLIVAHAYGIKALWTTFGEKSLVGDDVKFLDYFSSVHIPEYEPFIWNKDESYGPEITDFIEMQSNINRININLFDLQKNLLKVCPFPLDFKNNIDFQKLSNQK